MSHPNDAKRITVRLSDDLHTRLRVFAAGRNAPAPPDVSQIVREALEYYLSVRTRLTRRQTRQRQKKRQRGLVVLRPE